jgi:hypothetical protein
MHPICIQEYVSKIFPNSISICLIFFAKIVLGCIVYNKAKEMHVRIILLVVKAFIRRTLKILVLVVKDQLKRPIEKKKTLSFWVCLLWDALTTTLVPWPIRH